MNTDDILQLIDSLIDEDISIEDHQRLQRVLKEDSAARALFRERIDLESGLRTIASSPDSVTDLDHAPNPKADAKSRPWVRQGNLVVWAVAACVLVVISLPFLGFLNRDIPENANERRTAATQDLQRELLGTIRQQDDCRWEVGPAVTGRLAAGRLTLSKGVAQLNFDSGTEITLESPCEIDVTSPETALLLSGTAFVSVTELSNGFTLNTPESRIIDEGTQYAVSIDEDATEVHVFDGRVVWIPDSAVESTSATFEDRINAGQAKRYPRATPTKAKVIPFGQRQFVRQLEQSLRESVGDSLIAYDGFENLVGRIRRGRSGFGWAEGWQPGGVGRGRLADVVNTPNETVFGLDRTDRRQLAMAGGDDIRRMLERPIDLKPGKSLFLGVLLRRMSPDDLEGSQSIQFSLEPDLPGRGRRLHQLVSFGISPEGFPFINSGKTITTTASPFPTEVTHLCVLKLESTPDGILPTLRIYHANDSVDVSEPLLWTVTGETGTAKFPAHSIRIIAGENATWHVDELKVGTTWQAVTM
ncbi:MAG: FecR domain-containing protein [Planctomycetota bacterium]